MHWNMKYMNKSWTYMKQYYNSQWNALYGVAYQTLRTRVCSPLSHIEKFPLASTQVHKGSVGWGMVRRIGSSKDHLVCIKRSLELSIRHISANSQWQGINRHDTALISPIQQPSGWTVTGFNRYIHKTISITHFNSSDAEDSFLGQYVRWLLIHELMNALRHHQKWYQLWRIGKFNVFPG